MDNRKNNYRFENDYVVGICADGIEFLIDTDDYERVSKHRWRCDRNKINGTIDYKTVSMARFILNLENHNGKKVLLKHPLDYRKENLFYGNKFTLRDGYYDVECFDGTIFQIDYDDYDMVSQYVWHLSNDYICGKVNKKGIKIHRLLLNASEGQEIDHINKNPLDNRRINLRITDRSTNCINRRMSNKNHSGVKGVYADKNDKYIAQINTDGKRLYLGYFDNFEDAAKVRKDAEAKYHKNKYFEEKSTISS